jgi:1-acyl-sn-glycerol-3-phosphate acyltransferase
MFYWILQFLAWPVVRVLYGYKARGAGHVPTTGGVVLAANHASFLDPPMIALGLPLRPVSFMAKEELFRVPVFGWAIRALYAVSVHRGGLTRSQLRSYLGLVGRDGGALVVFPEGTRSRDGSIGRAQRGVGAICRMAGVPVIPVLVTGTWRAWPRTRLLPLPWGHIEVRFGAPVQWTDEELNASGDASGALATLIMKRITELHDTEEAPMGFWKGYRLLLSRAFPAGPRIGARPVSQGGGVDHRGKSD